MWYSVPNNRAEASVKPNIDILSEYRIVDQLIIIPILIVVITSMTHIIITTSRNEYEPECRYIFTAVELNFSMAACFHSFYTRSFLPVMTFFSISHEMYYFLINLEISFIFAVKIGMFWLASGIRNLN